MANRQTQRDGNLYLEAEIIRKHGVINKGITGRQCVSFSIDAHSGSNAGGVHRTMKAEFSLKNGETKVCTLKEGMNDFCMPLNSFNGRNVSVKVSARYKIGLMSSKTLALRISKWF